MPDLEENPEDYKKSSRSALCLSLGRGCICSFFLVFFKLVCLLTGQLAWPTFSPGDKFLRTTSFFVGLMILPLSFFPVLFGVMICFTLCPFPGCDDVPSVNITAEQSDIHFGSIVLIHHYSLFVKAVFLIAAVSGFLSYSIFLWALWSGQIKRVWQYVKWDLQSSQKYRNFTQTSNHRYVRLQQLHMEWGDSHKTALTINPFDDRKPTAKPAIKVTKSHDHSRPDPLTFSRSMHSWNQIQYSTTNLDYTGQQFSFTLALVMIMTVYVILTVLTITATNSELKHYRQNNGSWILWIDKLGLACQGVLQFCNAVSVLIFSKLVHGICCLLKSTYRRFIKANIPLPSTEFPTEHEWAELKATALKWATNKEERDYLRQTFDSGHEGLALAQLCYLKVIDEEVVSVISRSLKPFQKWFPIHWFLFMLTSLMTIPYVVMTIKLEPRDTVKYHQIAALGVLYSLQSFILLIYPCLKGFTIDPARKRLIRQIAKVHWVYVNEDVRRQFVEYMKDQFCGLMLSIGGAKVPLVLNLSHVAIFIGVAGMILKLSL